MIMVKEGDYVKQGQPLFKLANLSSVWAVFDAYENQVSLLKKGQKINIVTNAYPNNILGARIVFIDPILNATRRTVEVRAELENKNGQLKPGMFVKGTIQMISSQKDDTIIIPESAVLWTGERSVVYIRTNPNEPVFEMREVALGDMLNEGYIVLNGLQNGDEIVTNGTFTVDAAAQLKGKKSMMNEEAGEVKISHTNHN
jgi:Cu(I)/Ag(I) efflux system membrane fusion protein